MSWALTAMAVGTAMKVGGGMITRNDQLKNAQNQAAARNASLQKNLGTLQGFEDQNQGFFKDNVGNYAPDKQSTALAGAQDKRTAGNVGNITTQDPNSIPLPGDASPASRSDLAKRMLATHDLAVSRAKATGKLGGYTDAWAGNQLGNAQAGRDIATINNYAAGRKALIQPESDMAAAAAYKPPSIWGDVLSGAGSIASAAGGAGFGGAAKAPAAENPFIPYGPGY